MDRLTISLSVEMENAYPGFGLVTATTTAAITQMKVQTTVQPIHANHPSSDVLMEGAFSTPGDVITKMIVVTELTNWIANTKIALTENSPAKITDVSLKLKNVTVSMIAKTTVLLTNL
jgi:hypothetical protein